MERILTPADRVITEIGHLALGRPWLSALLMLTAITITLLSNNPINFSVPSHSTTTVQSIAIPAPTPRQAENTFVSADVPISTPTATVATAEAVATPAIKTPAAAPITPVKTPQKTSPSSNGLNYMSGQIKHSLFADARKAGLSNKQANQLVQIFSPKNIAQSLRSGDHFSVLYEDPKTIKKKKYTGNIVAARLTHKDKTYQLIRFADPKGRINYYTPQGQTLVDGILREPLHFDHISSGFSKDRLDPVLHYRRPHYGVDFAAPTGTPIKAAGDGVVVTVGYHGGYGKSITLKHDDTYSTLYAHMSQYAHLRAGDSVQKGETIGYVGQTGFATGPHLHFEIHVNGVPYNPLTVALPGGSIPKAYRQQFLAQSRVLLAQLNSKQKQIQLAQKEQSTEQS